MRSRSRSNRSSTADDSTSDVSSWRGDYDTRTQKVVKRRPPKNMGDKEDRSPEKEKPQQRSGKSFTAEVVLLDGEHVNIEVDRNGEGRELFEKVCKHLDLIETEYFGLQYVDERIPQPLKCWLSPDKKISKQKKRGPWIFDFALKFYPPDPTALRESLTRWLVTLQTRRDVLSGKLPATFLTQAMLGSYCVQADIGDYDSNEHHGVEYIKDIPFAPNQSIDLLEKIVELHRQHKGQTPDEAELHFLENAKKLSMYGVDLHAAQDVNNVDIMLGVCASGLQVYRDKLRISRFVWPKILKISYKRKHFYIKVRPMDNKHGENTVSFKLATHRLAKRLWKICVEHHAFFRLREADQPNNSAMFPRLGSKFRYSGRTLYQARHSSQTLDRPDPAFERSQPARNTYAAPSNRSKSVDELTNRPDYWKDDMDSEIRRRPSAERRDGRNRKDHMGQPTVISIVGLPEGMKPVENEDGPTMRPGDDPRNRDGRDRRDRRPGDENATLERNRGPPGTMGLTPSEVQRAGDKDDDKKKGPKRGRGRDPTAEDRRDVSGAGDGPGRMSGNYGDQEPEPMRVEFAAPVGFAPGDKGRGSGKDRANPPRDLWKPDDEPEVVMRRGTNPDGSCWDPDRDDENRDRFSSFRSPGKDAPPERWSFGKGRDKDRSPTGRDGDRDGRSPGRDGDGRDGYPPGRGGDQDGWGPDRDRGSRGPGTPSRWSPDKDREGDRWDPNRSRDRDSFDPNRSRDGGRLDPNKSRDRDSFDPNRSRDGGRLDPNKSRDRDSFDPNRSRDGGRLDPNKSRDRDSFDPNRSRDRNSWDPNRSRDGGRWDPNRSRGPENEEAGPSFLAPGDEPVDEDRNRWAPDVLGPYPGREEKDPKKGKKKDRKGSDKDDDKNAKDKKGGLFSKLKKPRDSKSKPDEDEADVGPWDVSAEGDIFIPRGSRRSSPRDSKGYSPRDGPGFSPRNSQGNDPRDGSLRSPRDGSLKRPQDGSLKGPRDGSLKRPRDSPGYSPRDSRGNDPRDDSRYGPQDGPGYGPRDSQGNDPRDDSRYGPGYNPRDSQGNDPRDDPRNGPRHGPGYSPRDGPGYSPRDSQGKDPRDDPRYGPQDGPGYGPRDNQGNDPRDDSRYGPGYNPRDSQGNDPRDDPRNGPRHGPGYSPRDGQGYDPRGSRGYDPRDDPPYSPYGSGYDPRDNQRYDPRDEPAYSPRNGPGYGPRDSQGYDPRDPRGYDPQDPRGYDPRNSRGYDPRDPRGYDPQDSRGYDPRDDPGYGPRGSRGYDPRGGPGYDPRDGPRYGPGYGPGYSPGYGPGYCPGYKPGYGPGYDPRYDPGYQGSGYPGYGPGLGAGAGDLSGVVGEEKYVDNKIQFEPIVPRKKETKDSLKRGGLDSVDRTMPFFSPAATSTVGRPSKVPPPVPPKANNSLDESFNRIDYKTEKDGIPETRVEHKVVLSSTDDDFDYDAALAEAIRSVTEFNPDMSVERIECVQQIEDVKDSY